MSRTVTAPVAVVALALSAALGIGAGACVAAYRRGYVVGATDAYREVNRVLRDLNASLDVPQPPPGVDAHGRNPVSPEHPERPED